MTAPRCALYARVSTDRQVQSGTIESQVAAIETRISEDGIPLETIARYLDDGYSGGTLHRPGLERLRDAIAAGLLDRLYVLEPDRLAREFVQQWLLIEEIAAFGVTLIWVQHPPATTPEEELLVQIQGCVAQYERTKIVERCRRGRRHAAQQGGVHVLSHAPYGYRYIPKAHGGGAAQYEVDLAEARVVRQVFTWVGEERCSLAEVCRRLEAAGIPSRKGKPRWQRPTIADLLSNPAYRGAAAFGRHRIVTERGTQRRRRVLTPEDEWISIPVPPLVSAELFAAAAQQVASEQRRVQPRGSGSLLTGLLRCGDCGAAWVGHTNWRDCATGRAWYRYYRCQGTDRRRWGGERRCASRCVPMDALDTAVWSEVQRLLAQPEQVLEEWQRRLSGAGEQEARHELRPLERQLRQVEQMRERLIDSYAEGVITKADLTSRLRRYEERVARLQDQQAAVEELVAQEAELRLVLGRLEEFAAAVQQGLEDAPGALQRQLITTLVQRIELRADGIRVVFRVQPGPAPPGMNLHYCTDRATEML
jgi:site-specific DNA recombinase